MRGLAWPWTVAKPQIQLRATTTSSLGFSSTKPTRIAQILMPVSNKMWQVVLANSTSGLGWHLMDRDKLGRLLTAGAVLVMM